MSFNVDMDGGFSGLVRSWTWGLGSLSIRIQRLTTYKFYQHLGKMGNILATCQQDPMQNVGQVVKALPAESKQEEKKSEPTNHAPLTVEEVIVRNEASLPPAPPTKEEEAYITPVQETAPSSDVTTTPAVVPSESESSDDLKAKAVVRARNEAEQLKSEEEKLVEAALEKKKEEESIALEVAEKVKVAEELIDKAVKLRKAKEAKANDDKVAEAVTLAAYNEDIVKEQHRRREIASEEAQKKVENALAKKEEVSWIADRLSQTEGHLAQNHHLEYQYNIIFFFLP